MLREEVLKALLAIDSGEESLEEVLNVGGQNEKDAGLYREIVKGVFRHKITLDYAIESFMNRKNQKLHKPIEMILRMAFYQWIYLDRVPAHAIVNESVNLAKKVGHKGSVAFVNAVLRKATKEKIHPEDWKFSSLEEEINIKYSLPMELTSYLIKSYGEDWTLDFARHSIEIPATDLRVNTSKISTKDLLDSLTKEGIQCKEIPGLDGLRVLKGNIFSTRAFKEGFFYVQDQAAMEVADFALKGQEKELKKALDVCGAPGGKSIGLALMRPDLKIQCCDVSIKKVKRIQDNIQRLGLKNIDPKLRDGQRPSKAEKEAFDLVLLDAPCSGFGLLKRKPEIKYKRTLKDIKSLVSLQKSLLEASATCLKVGGILVYSTCTISKEENEYLMEDFLKNREDFTLVDQKSLPLNQETDGFKMFKLVKTC